MSAKVVSVTSVFPVPPEEIWSRLVKVETLQYIASPYAKFSPVDPAEGMVWKEGATFRFRLRIFGVISLGEHTDRVEKFDKGTLTIKTAEGNKSVPVWNHSIFLVPLDASSTRYTDEVEISAGWRTGMVYLWSRSFYRHRQRKWLRLLAKSP